MQLLQASEDHLALLMRVIHKAHCVSGRSLFFFLFCLLSNMLSLSYKCGLESNPSGPKQVEILLV